MELGLAARPGDGWLSRTRSFPARLSWRMSLVLLGLGALVIGLAVLDVSPVGAAVDDAMYVILAKSIATGQGYRSLNVPGAPPNTHFPPGYPAALALLWRAMPAFPANVILFRLFNVACLAAAAVGVARLAASRGVHRRLAIALGAVTAVSVPLLVLGNMLLSEPFFLALLVFLLAALERHCEPASTAPRTVIRAAALGVAIGLCVLVRSHGIVLVPATVIALGVQRRWREAGAVAVAAVLVMLPWQVFSARHAGGVPAPLLGGYDSYTAWWVRGLRALGWQMVPRTLARTIPEAGVMFAALFSPFRDAASHAVTLAALGALVVAGVADAWRRIPVTLLFIASYIAIVLVWPFQPGRFIWGVWPLILFVLVLGARAPARRVDSWPHALRLALVASVCWVSLGYVMYEVRAARGRWWSSIPRAARDHIAFAVGWTRANTAPGDVVATEDEGPVYLYSGRRTVPVRSFTVTQYLGDPPVPVLTAEGLRPILASYPVRAVVVYTGAGIDIAKHLSAGPAPLLAPRGQLPGGSAFTVLP